MTPAPLVLASQNPKKSRELDALLRPLGWQVQALSGFTADSPVEDAPTFVENALIKARHAARISGLPAIADDSGLAVGTWPGQILDAPRGDGGFGYDPLFLVPERQRSAAELGADEKARLSHRGRALRSLMQQLAADAR